MKVFSDLATTAYGISGHPEAPFRVAKTFQRLAKGGFRPEMPDVDATQADVLTVHTPRHWDQVRSGDYADADTPHFPGMEEIALISLSGALSAYESARAGEPAFSLMRPPGHHAAAERVAGFCYVNNIAVACTRALKDGLRVAVLDVDVHHGDGTEAIALGKKGWLFTSLHQSPLYPGSGLASRDNCLNYPLPPFTGEKEYLPALEQAIKDVMDFKPDILGVSAGFDTYKDCPIAQMKLEQGTYLKIGKLIAQTKLKRFAVLEGGYAPDLPILIENSSRASAVSCLESFLPRGGRKEVGGTTGGSGGGSWSRGERDLSWSPGGIREGIPGRRRLGPSDRTFGHAPGAPAPRPGPPFPAGTLSRSGVWTPVCGRPR